VLTYSI